MPTLRLLTYNVRSLRDDYDALCRVIRAAEPHVVCIQEAPRFLRWGSLAAKLARDTGLVVVTGGRPAAANLLLSSLAVDVLATRDVKFTKKWPGEWKLHRRGSAMARLRLGGVPFAVAGTHLDVVDGPRVRHVVELHAALSAFAADTPSVVAGDVNDRPGEPGWAALTAVRTDAWSVAGEGDGFTSQAKTPVQRLDGVFVDHRLTVVSAVVIDGEDVEKASDHRPLLVEIDL